MAWNYYLNIEPVALQAAAGSIEMMTGSNYELVDGCAIPSDGDFENNLRHGFIALVMLCAFYESSLNTLLREACGFRGEDAVLRCSAEVKLEVLFFGRADALAAIKQRASWRELGRAISMRNQLVHYKNNDPGIVATIPPLDTWKLGREILGDFFTRGNFVEIFNGVCDAVHGLAEALGFEFNPASSPLACDAMTGSAACFCRPAAASEAREARGSCPDGDSGSWIDFIGMAQG